MALTKYKKLRNIKKTGEPRATLKRSKTPIFVIHKHHASHLHWDLRLEINGVLKSWAVPKEPPTTKGIKRLAIAVEDHPLAYADFEGTIPEWNYGAGTVKIWDKGDFALIKKNSKEVEFKLQGKKMKGTFVLIKTKYGAKPGKSWLFFKI